MNRINTPTISTDYLLHVEPTDNALLRVLARRWNITEAAMLSKLVALALHRSDVRTGAEAASYRAELERIADQLKQTNGTTRRTYAVAI